MVIANWHTSTISKVSTLLDIRKWWVLQSPFDSEDRKLDVVLDENSEVSSVSQQSTIFAVTHTHTHTHNDSETDTITEAMATPTMTDSLHRCSQLNDSTVMLTTSNCVCQITSSSGHRNANVMSVTLLTFRWLILLQQPSYYFDL